MNSIRFASKESFIDALEARRPFWRRYDERRARHHQKAEEKYLADSRKKLQEALTWDYKTLAKKAGFSLTLGSVPQCPLLMEAKMDAVLAALKVTEAKSFTVDSHGVWDSAHYLLTGNPDARKTVC